MGEPNDKSEAAGEKPFDLKNFLINNRASDVHEMIYKLLASGLDFEAVLDQAMQKAEKELNQQGFTLSESNRKEFEALRLTIRNIINRIIMCAVNEAYNIQLEKYSEKIVLGYLEEILTRFKIRHKNLNRDTEFIELLADSDGEIDDFYATVFGNNVFDHFACAVKLGEIYKILHKKGSTVGDLIEYLQSLGKPAEVKA
ncbi:MAG: hypothetical protein WCV72_04090 [Patescibacteria group bacterium]|jgi:hypothetical protein